MTVRAGAAGRARGPRYRRSSHLVAFWEAGELSVYDYEAKRATRVTPLAVDLLQYFGTGRSLAEAQRRFRRFRPTAVAHAVRSLVRRGLLDMVRSRSRASPLDGWNDWSPAAAFFHFSTKDVPFGEGDARTGAPARAPSSVKRVPAVRTIALPREVTSGSFPEVLQSRRTWRRFGRAPVPLESLATLLGLTFRLRRKAPGRGAPPITLRSSPSPGARHALEAYVVARKVRGLPRGLYHYSADRHQLERVGSRAALRATVDYLPTQWWYTDAAAVVFITAVFPRVWWRYDYPRAYRAVLIEAGHFCQTFLLTATWLGLAPFCSMALADSLIERDLGIDGVTESVLYAAGVGVRPPGVDWAPTPAPKRGRMSR